MKINIFLIFFLIFFLNLSITNANNFIQTKIDGHILRVIEYDIKSNIYDIKILPTPVGTSDNLRNILEENNAITGVNGIFFNVGNSTTNNERYINGLKHAVWPTTDKRAVFGWDIDKNPFIFQTDFINSDKELDIYEGFSNWPLLLLDGVPQTEYYWDYGMIAKNMTNNQNRNFICSNEDKSKIYFGLVSNINIDKLAGILKIFGCHDALNLDAGGSTAFIYNGRYIAGPGRNVVDAVGIVPSFNLSVLDKQAKNISDKLIEFIKTKNEKRQIVLYDYYVGEFLNLRTKIYEKFSKDIVDDFGEVIGYKITLNTKNSAKISYLINRISYHLSLEKKYFIDLKINLENLDKKEIINNDENLENFEDIEIIE